MNAKASEELAIKSEEVAKGSAELTKTIAGNAKAGAENDIGSEELAKGSEENDNGSAGNVLGVLNYFVAL